MTGYSSSTGFYVHAKTIIADYGTSAQKAFAGSENLTSNSLNDNRELGLIVSDAGVVDGLETTFDGDFSGSSTGKVSIFGPGSLTSAVGSSVDYQVQGEDTCTGTLSYAASGLPKGLSINSSTGVISGTASTAGTYNVTLTGTDSTGPSGSATFTWTVGSAAANTVTVTNPGSQTGTVGTAVSLQISASDSASGQTLTYSATGLPAGLSIGSDDRPDLRHADHRGQQRRDGHRDRHDRRLGVGVASPSRSAPPRPAAARSNCSSTEASKPVPSRPGRPRPGSSPAAPARIRRRPAATWPGSTATARPTWTRSRRRSPSPPPA